MKLAAEVCFAVGLFGLGVFTGAAIDRHTRPAPVYSAAKAPNGAVAICADDRAVLAVAQGKIVTARGRCPR